MNNQRVKPFIQAVNRLKNARCDGNKIYYDFQIPGWCHQETMFFLNLVVGHFLNQDEQYLEIGTYCGKSLVAALYKNYAKAQVIEPFEKHLPDGVHIRSKWVENISRFGLGSENRVTLHNEKCEQFDGDLPEIGVFYYDGNHDSGHTYEALKKYEKYLADNAIIIVDDYYIGGGDAQTPYPGYDVVDGHPVKVDTDRWVSENQDKARIVWIMPCENHQAVILYRRNGHEED